jgi:hypothetical protein
VPPLLCLSPGILDQSRQREITELRRIAIALGTIAQMVSEDSVRVLLTPMMREVVGEFAGHPWKYHALMQDIFRLLSQWFLQKHGGLVELDPASITGNVPHPVPFGCAADGLVMIWADEMGKLLIVHDEYGPKGGFSIGIACDKGFAGESLGEYSAESAGQPRFPLVDPQAARSLLDAYEWEYDGNVQRRKVTIEAAKSNCFALGCTKVLPPRRDSHCKFIFPGKRSWTLSLNVNPVPVAYLQELCGITGYPMKVVRHALLTGSLPPRRLRFRRYVC